MENQALDLDTQIRLTAMQLAVAASKDLARVEFNDDLIRLAEQIASFIKGETTNG